ncbi:positive regulator of gluconeogenesis [Tepidanaerobacter acetatoxydans Re1]|uniref:Putative pyruvate, phosphate dikinase regulatory protein n=1 Tax=Tepidanaerobacter acetatoxydans (strain DSM 21804 / JCM 16047 / Re1) TaxID=1209989 RepID=F4LSZ4_TEPAE|nr:pyruvate, water dikinase regulatory protein [Tepidanaerobacter acetatoxydans]AEE91263.1 phosphotransferase ydiA [Tepidanaerobacter acetatoxydans Re1]CDI40610.1 positive regulator of gluconeogenesis [Tepidanaerobacter acetatoxydans Re1]
MIIKDKKSQPVVFAVSDSIGETAELVIRAAMVQFNSDKVDIRKVPYVTDNEYVEDIIEEAKNTADCVIVCTIILPEVRQHLLSLAEQNQIPIVDLMGPMMDTFSKIIEVKPHLQPGLVHRIDEDYFKKIEAIEFAVQYDDGKDPRGLSRADVVLIGVSRTSKTPLAMFLAHKRLKVANLRLVPEVAPPDELFHLPPKTIIGLTISPEKLFDIRQERLKALGLSTEATYAQLSRIMEEIEYADMIMEKIGCPKIDVSNKAVEEIATSILEIIRKGEV